MILYREIGDRLGEGRTLGNLGSAYSSLGQYQQGINHYQQALPILKALGHRQIEINTLMGLGNTYNDLREYQQAIEYYQQALIIQQEIGDKAGVVSALSRLGKAYKSLEEHQKVVEYYQQTLTLQRELGDENGAASSLKELGNAYLALGDYQKAFEYDQESLTVEQEARQTAIKQSIELWQQSPSSDQQIGDRSREADWLRGLGYGYSLLREYQKAIEYYQQELTICQEIGNRSKEARSLFDIGCAYSFLEQHQKAIDLYQQALKILREIDNHQLEANNLEVLGYEAGGVLMALSNSYSQLGQNKEAIECRQQALSIRGKVLGRRQEADFLTHLGDDCHYLGQYQKEIEYYQQALTIYREIGNRSGEAKSLDHIGLTYRYLGQYLRSIEYHQQALVIRQQIGDQSKVASSLNSLGAAYMYLGQSLRAINYFQQGLTIYREIGDHSGVGNSLSKLGLAYYDLGQYQQAIEYHRQSLAIDQEIRHQCGQAGSLINMGQVYARLAQYHQAIELYQQGLDIARQIKYRQWEANALSNLGSVFSSLRQYQEAIKYYQQAIEVKEFIQSDLKIEELKASFVAQQINTYQQLITLLCQEERFKEAFNYVERSKARAFLDQFANGPINFRSGVSAKLLQREESLKTEITTLRTQITNLLKQEYSLHHQITALRAQLVNLRSHPHHKSDTEAITTLQKQLIRLEKDYTNLLTELKLQSPETASLVSVEVATLEDIQSLLNSNTTLIEYFVTRKRTLAFIITDNTFQTITINITQENLTQKIEAFRRFASLKNPHPKSLQQLYEWLITPLKPLLNTSQLAIVPHGILHYLPFAALSTGEHYLCDDYTLFTLPSASILPFLPQKRKPSTGTLLALGNPTPIAPLPTLHFAEQEVNAIASLYNTQALIGAAATKSVVVSQSENVEILHLAVHGEFNKHNPLFSTLYLAPDTQQDGRLEVHDIYTLDLTKTTNLVVLSACQTQLGELSKGDEIVGLNRAFLYAGTPNIIATLWSVNDKVTGLLMEQFYINFRSGMTVAEALRLAQKEIRIEYPHPYYWAAFVLTGDGGVVDRSI